MRASVVIVILSMMFCIGPEARSQSTEREESTNVKSEPKEPVFTPPKLLEYVQAEYPKEAFEKGIEAAVVAELDVDENGLVIGVKITQAAGQGFDEAATDAMYRFVFAPAMQDGAPIPSRVLYRYTFFIKKDEPPPKEQPAPSASLSGTVTDMEGKPAAQASVVLTPLSQADKTPAEAPLLSADREGKFAFLEIAPGAYQVDVAAPGFKPYTTDEELEGGETREVVYRLETEEVLYETVVRAKRPPREVTRREITRREITRIPGTGGDAMRSVQNLPGLARAPSMSGALIVRGSSPQDSQYYFDQMPVPLLYHFGGLTSIINSDLLDSIVFFPGNYGVRYGGATGGVVEVYPRAPATDRVHAYVDADFWDIGALVETPLGEHWSVAVSARRSYIDALLNAAMPDEGGMKFTVAPRYYDYQVVANYHPSAKDELQLFVFGTDDKLVLVFGDEVADNPEVSGGINLSMYFHQAQARWEHRFTKTISNKVNVASGFQSSYTSLGDFMKYDSKAVPVYLRDELIYDNNGPVALRTGLDAKLLWAKWQVRAPNVLPTEGESMDPITSDQEMLETTGDNALWRAGWYGELELRPLPDLRLINGLRVEYFSQVGEVGVDPRFVLRFEIIKGTILKGGVGLFHQTPQDQESDDVFGNPDLDLINAVHYSIGAEQKITENIEVGIEGFFKDLSNLVVSSDEMIERDGEMVPERYDNDGTGRVYGLEFLLKHNPTDRLFGWISYTLMKSSRVDHPGGEERRFDYDQTHILTVVASAVLGRGWEAGVRFRLVTGNPDTPILGSVYDSDSDIYLPIYGDVNSARLPTFHQLDLRIDKNWQWKYLKLAIYIDVQNIYNQRNPEGYSYNYDYSEKQYFYGLPVLPSLGIKLEY